MKSVSHLAGIYDNSVGRGANMLINVAPDDRGLIPDEYIQRLQEFRAELDRRYGSALPFGEVRLTDTDAVIEAAAVELVDTIVIEEDTREGESIGRFRITANMPSGSPINIFEGNTVGHKRICHFPAIFTDKITVHVTASEGTCKLKKLTAYHTET